MSIHEQTQGEIRAARAVLEYIRSHTKSEQLQVVDGELYLAELALSRAERAMDWIVIPK